MQDDELRARRGSAMSTKRVAPTSRGSSAYPRKRAVTACQVCRVRRTKCDQKKPACSFCSKIGAECVFDPSALSTFDPASLEIIERLDRLERKLDNPLHPRYEHPTEQHGVPSNAHAPLNDPHALLPGNLDAVLKWAVFQDLAPSPVVRPGVSSPILPGMLGRIPVTGDELDPASCNEWLDNFFNEVHIKNPILDEQHTRRLVRKVCLEGAGWDTSSCLALVVCANGALVREFRIPSLEQHELEGSVAMSLFAAAQKRLGPVMVATGVVQAQCVFFVGVFLMSVLQPVEAWRMFLQALAICQSFKSSSRKVSQDNSSLSDSAAAEESIYWSCWKSEQELRWELGPSDFSSRALGPPQLFPSIPDACKDQNIRAWYFYLSEISLWRLDTETRQEMTKVVTEGRSGVLRALADIGDSTLEQLAVWQESLAPPVSLAGHDPPSTDNDIIRFVLRGRTTYIHELISWPFIQSMINEENDSPRTMQWVVNGLSFHLERLVVNRPGFYHRHHGTWLMLRSSARSACILLACAYLPSTSKLMPSEWKEAVEATIQMLEYWRGQTEGIGDAVDLMHQLFTLV
ncbi:hypothetical protein G7Z17_g1188 [Cylindrodendrum hubeiense]|uniref:Zn(2)-C6 fungal-type domain-containing protein n=1 Tax=Cylindrodendrum hubeiense TaxID=595255 RepID=A0A9P5LFH5_9HYPO|nr:hypothetical protein G7Z17_g1188 [Cylindrodendrum hubeiense]